MPIVSYGYGKERIRIDPRVDPPDMLSAKDLKPKSEAAKDLKPEMVSAKED